jgi:hypothetical protein
MAHEQGNHLPYQQQPELQQSHDDVMATSPLPNFQAMYGPAASQSYTEQRQREAAESKRIESLKILDKDAFKLGDLNPLIHPTDLTRKESVDAVSHIVMEKISQHGGLDPRILESGVVIDPEAGKADLRFIARFEVPTLTEAQLVLLEELVRETYGGTSVRTRRDSKGNKIPASNYPPTQPGEEMLSKTGGWYMGPFPTPTSSLHQGLFVFKDYGPINDENFLDEGLTPRKFIIEIREARQYQTDLVTFITQVSTILAKEEKPDRGQLLYESYYDLIRLGLKKAESESIYGMGHATDMIRRELILPLASPDISRGVKEEPQSVLMIGVPGTGKTLMVEKLLHDETGLFVLPIDPFELQREVAQPKEKQYLMPRIAEIARITGKRVVLHVDDIENMVGENDVTNSTMLNLMAGVQESGFYIIASTNFPEKINPSLLQPQRFSVLIHCGLHDKNARYEILKIHANAQSLKHNKPLFASAEIRDLILREVAEHTEAFTPRYLQNIATVAKSFLVDRVSREKGGQIIGLTEEDLEGFTFTIEDWEKAFVEVSAKYDSKKVKDYDQRLERFVRKQKDLRIGFANGETSHSRIFSNKLFEQVVAAEVKLQKD